MKVAPNGIAVNVTYLLMEIIKKYFLSDAQLYGIVVLYDYPIEGSWNREYMSGIEYVLNELSIDNQIVLQWIRMDWQSGSNDSNAVNLLQQHIETGAEAFITITNKLDSFLTMKYDIQQYSTQRLRDRMFLFLGNENTEMAFFQHPALDIYPHHLLVIPSKNSDHSLDLLTQKFVGIENTKLPVNLDTFYLINCTFKRNSILYPDKLNDLEGRIVTVAAFSYEPYIFYERKEPNENLYRESNSTDGEKTIFYDGSEARVIINFCILTNCTLEFLIVTDWGTINRESGYSIGQVGALYTHVADIAVASIGQWYFDLFESSSAIARSACTLVVPAPRPLPYVYTPILPFDLKTWLYFFGTLVLCTISFYLVKVFSEILVLKRQNLSDSSRTDIRTSFRSTILEVLEVFLQQSVEIGTMKSAVRIVYAIFFLAAIIWQNAYVGGLHSLLTVPKLVGKINTIHDYVETNYAWGAPHEVYINAVKLSQVRDSMLMKQRVKIVSHDKLYNMSFSGKFGVAVERLHSGRILYDDYVTLDTLEHFTVLKDDLFYEYTMAITTRGWPLMYIFNKVALESMQHGLFQHWESELYDTSVDFAIGNRLQDLVAGKTEDLVPEVLRTEHITGPLIMLFVGEICALIAFIGEHSWVRLWAKQMTG